MLCSYYKNPVNAGITFIPSADLYYRLVEFYSLSTIKSSMNIKHCIVFLNTLIIKFHIYTIIYITRMSCTKPIHIIILLFTQIARCPGGYRLLRNTQGMCALHVRTCPAPCMEHARTRTYSYILPIFFYNFCWKLYSCNMHSINYYDYSF